MSCQKLLTVRIAKRRGNGSTSLTPAGWHQVKNLKGTYNHAVDRGHLLGYALIGGLMVLMHLLCSKYCCTKQPGPPRMTLKKIRPQNYYEGLVRKALDRIKEASYCTCYCMQLKMI